MSSADNIELQAHVRHVEPEVLNGKGSSGKAEEGITFTTAVTDDTTVENDHAQEKWNYPRRNIYKTGAAFWGMFQDTWENVNLIVL